jgi:hypothetical protein
MSNYVKGVVDKYSPSSSLSEFEAKNVFYPLCGYIDNWALRNGYSLLNKQLSGSRAKGTAITISSDLDIFISLSSATVGTLSEIYNSLYDYFQLQKIQCRKQNVSIGVTYNNKSVDLVPGKRQHNYGDDHSLYKRKQDTWIQTNITTHINTVCKSNRTVEIKATKIWRERHSLDFPSLFLELAVIEATKYRNYNDYDNNFWEVLKWLQTNIATVKIVDPANSNNILSDDLAYSEKKAIADMAYYSLQKQNWAEIIW